MLRKRSKPPPPVPEADSDGDKILIGEDLDSKKSYWLSLEDWRTHWHVPGAPGTGKTSLLEVLLRALIEQRQGLCLIDPIGVVFDRIVNFLSWHPELAEDVIIISPGDTDPYWPGFNPLKRVPYIEDANVHADLIADAICKVYGDDRSSTPLLSRKSEEVAEPLIQAGMTFLEFPFFYRLNQSVAREKLASYSQADGIAEEWAEFENLNRAQRRDELGSLRNRMPRFVRNRAVRLILGRNENTIDLADIVENQKKLLINLAPKRGVLGPSHSYLLACLFVGFITSYMRSRSQEQAESNKFFVILDEFQNMLTPDIAGALDELRNFGLRMVMAHQRFGQLVREDQDLLDAVMTDARIKAVFGGLSPEALEILEPFIYMGQHDFKQIKYQTYLGQEAIPHFYNLEELRYQKQAELYRQPNQHMTLKVGTEPPRRIKVASVEPYPRDEARRKQLMEMTVANHPHYYLQEAEILELISERTRWLQEPEEQVPVSFRVPKNKSAVHQP